MRKSSFQGPCTKALTISTFSSNYPLPCVVGYDERPYIEVVETLQNSRFW